MDNIKFIAAVLDDGHKGDELFDAAQKLCKAFSDLLDAAKPGEAVRIREGNRLRTAPTLLRLHFPKRNKSRLKRRF